MTESFSKRQIFFSLLRT